MALTQYFQLLPQLVVAEVVQLMALVEQRIDLVNLVVQVVVRVQMTVSQEQQQVAQHLLLGKDLLVVTALQIFQLFIMAEAEAVLAE
jgi:hypothetical protein